MERRAPRRRRRRAVARPIPEAAPVRVMSLFWRELDMVNWFEGLEFDGETLEIGTWTGSEEGHF